MGERECAARYHGGMTAQHAAITVTLIGKPGCHLCDDARDVVHAVIAEFTTDRIVVEEQSILQHPELFETFAEEIPVVLVNGAMHTYWRVEAHRLRATLKHALGRVGG